MKGMYRSIKTSLHFWHSCYYTAQTEPVYTAASNLMCCIWLLIMHFLIIFRFILGYPLHFPHFYLGQKFVPKSAANTENLLTTNNCRFQNTCTVMILSFRTDRPGQTVQTQIRLLLEEQSDEGLHCLPFRLHRLDPLLYGKAT